MAPLLSEMWPRLTYECVLTEHKTRLTRNGRDSSFKGNRYCRNFHRRCFLQCIVNCNSLGWKLRVGTWNFIFISRCRCLCLHSNDSPPRISIKLYVRCGRAVGAVRASIKRFVFRYTSTKGLTESCSILNFATLNTPTNIFRRTFATHSTSSLIRKSSPGLSRLLLGYFFLAQTIVEHFSPPLSQCSSPFYSIILFKCSANVPQAFIINKSTWAALKADLGRLWSWNRSENKNKRKIFWRYDEEDSERSCVGGWSVERIWAPPIIVFVYRARVCANGNSSRAHLMRFIFSSSSVYIDF